MNAKHISIIVAVVALLAGCAKSPIETPSGTNGLTDLELTHVGSTEVKSVINGTDFPEEGEIGLFLFKDELAETPYGESGYTNVKYSYDSGKKKWTASPSIKVGSDAGYLYGYYPYKAGTQEKPITVTAIPVASSLSGDDVMYAAKQEAITDKTAANTTITMNHALARVSITVKNNGYTGNAKLSQIKFSGAEIAVVGTLNAVDGTITATKSEAVTLTVPEASQAIATGSGSVYECLLVPSAVKADRQNVTLALTIDGEDKTASLSDGNGVIIAQGTKSNITIGLSNTGITVQTVSVENWDVVEVGGHKVTVKLAENAPANDVMFSAYAEGESVKVIAHSAHNYHLLYSRNDNGETMPPEVSDNIHTFTITDITKDVEVTIDYHRYSVTYCDDIYGTRTATDTVIGNSKVIRPKDPAFPSEAECRFIGWYTDADYVTAWNFITNPVTEDIVLYAKWIEGAAPGIFTVADPDGIPGSGDESKIVFSRGNLWYDSDGSVWSFEINQYDFRTYPGSASMLGGTYNVNGGTPANNYGLFGWGTSGYDHGAVCYRPTDISPTSSYYYAYGDMSKNLCDGTGKADWGYNAISNGGNRENSGWRTLSYDEFVHLSTKRPDAGLKWGHATVADEVHGLIILPDEFIDPKVQGKQGNAAFVPQRTAIIESGWDENEYSFPDWGKMHSAGAIFLPAAGRSDDEQPGKAYYVGEYGCYWHNGAVDYLYANRLQLTNFWINQAINGRRHIGQSVRLVIEYH